MDPKRLRALAEKAGFSQDKIDICNDPAFLEYTRLIIRECAWEVYDFYHPKYIFEKHIADVISKKLIEFSRQKN